MNVSARDGSFSLGLEKNSYLNGDIKFDWKKIEVVAEALLNIQAQITTDCRLETGFKWFGRCKHYARKTYGFNQPIKG